MASASPALPSTVLTGPTERFAIPKWLKRFEPRVVRPSKMSSLQKLPQLTFVKSAGIDSLLERRPFLTLLANRQGKSPETSKIVFMFDQPGDGESQLIELFGLFSRPLDLEVAFGSEGGQLAALEAMAKIAVAKQSESDPLARVQSVIDATSDLRAPSGRLAASLIAKAFGVSTAEIARLVGVSRQALSKTDDAPSIQSALLPFERVARLRSRLSRKDFLTWLEMPSEALGGPKPIEAIRSGRVSALANWVENMLVGNPT